MNVPETILPGMIEINGLWHKVGLNGHAYYFVNDAWIRSSKPASAVTDAIKAERENRTKKIKGHYY